MTTIFCAFVSISVHSRLILPSSKPRMNTKLHELQNQALPLELPVFEVQNHSDVKIRNTKIIQH